MRFEYLHVVFTNETVNLCNPPLDDLKPYHTTPSEALAILGDLSWELVSVCRFEVQSTGVYEMFFKRPLPIEIKIEFPTNQDVIRAHNDATLAAMRKEHQPPEPKPSAYPPSMSIYE